MGDIKRTEPDDKANRRDILICVSQVIILIRSL